MELQDIYIQNAMFTWLIHEVIVDRILPKNAGIFPSLQATEWLGFALPIWIVLRYTSLQPLSTSVPL